MGQRVYERIHKFAIGGFIIRVWCSSQTLPGAAAPYEQQEQRDAVQSILSATERVPLSLAEAVAKLPFCSAVEVLDGPSGVIVYPEWP